MFLKFERTVLKRPNWFSGDEYCFDFQFIHNLLEDPKHKIGTLVRFNRLIGSPNSEKNFTKASTIVFVLMFRSGIASGNLVEAHIMVKRY